MKGFYCSLPSKSIVAIAALSLLLTIQPCFAEQAPELLRASGERLGQAIGHYGRARSLLIEAIREFDRGANLARPDALIDSQEWRLTLMGRAEDLEKILAPQPRASRTGVRFEADTRLLNQSNK